MRKVGWVYVVMFLLAGIGLLAKADAPETLFTSPIELVRFDGMAYAVPEFSPDRTWVNHVWATYTGSVGPEYYTVTDEADDVLSCTQDIYGGRTHVTCVNGKPVLGKDNEYTLTDGELVTTTLVYTPRFQPVQFSYNDFSQPVPGGPVEWEAYISADPSHAQTSLELWGFAGRAACTGLPWNVQGDCSCSQVPAPETESLVGWYKCSIDPAALIGHPYLICIVDVKQTDASVPFTWMVEMSGFMRKCSVGAVMLPIIQR